MLRRERFPEGQPLFAGAWRWRAWRYWPGLLGLSSGFLLWFVVMAEVVVPLGGALARLQAGDPVPETRSTDVPRRPAARTPTAARR